MYGRDREKNKKSFLNSDLIVIFVSNKQKQMDLTKLKIKFASIDTNQDMAELGEDVVKTIKEEFNGDIPVDPENSDMTHPDIIALIEEVFPEVENDEDFWDAFIDYNALRFSCR
jgi:hypothetical protein